MAKAIDFQDEFENMGAQLIKKVASQTNDVAGDGALSCSSFRTECGRRI